MSSVPNACLDVNTGRPHKDAGYQNLKVSESTHSAKLSACEVSTGTLVVGELTGDIGSFNNLVVGDLTVDMGAINNLMVNNLTVTGNPPVEPSVIILPGLYSTSVGFAVYDPTLGSFEFGGPGASFTWTLNIPASNTRAIRFYLLSPLEVNVQANSVSLGNFNTPGINTTPTFVWAGGALTIVFTAVAGGMMYDPLVI